MLEDGIIIREELPPSEQVACYYGFHVHLKIIQWKKLDKTQSLHPASWGWKRDNGYLVLILTDKMLHHQTY